MKKLFLLLAFVTISVFSATGQSKVYCQLLGTQQLFSKKVTVQVDFGQQTKFFSDNRLVDQNGNVIVFNSMVDAMNHMGSLGWEFEQAYVVTLGSGAGASNVYHWLLSKYVGEEGDENELKTMDIIRKEQKVAAEISATTTEVPVE